MGDNQSVRVYKPLLEFIDEEKQNSRKQAFSKFCLGAYYYFEFGNIERNENGKLNRVLRNELRIRMECDITQDE